MPELNATVMNYILDRSRLLQPWIINSGSFGLANPNLCPSAGSSWTRGTKRGKVGAFNVSSFATQCQTLGFR